MTISATGRRYTSDGNGVTVNFSFPRPFNLDADLKVYLVTIATNVAVLQTYSTHYTVAGAGDPAGGTVTFLTAPPTGQKVVIFADTDATQNLDLDAVTSWPMTSIEYAFDRITVMVQEIWDRLSRTIYVPRERIETFDYKLPIPVPTYQLGVNSAGDGFEFRAPTGSTWIVAAGAPGAGTGVTGDMYINSSTGDVYGPKTTVWGSVVANIRGPAGSLTGPGSSIDNEIMVFDGVTGALAKSGGFVYTLIARKDTDNAFAAKQTFLASGASAASVNLPHGSAPSSPVDGDFWTTSAALLYRISGATKTAMDLETAQSIAAKKSFPAGTTGAASLLIAAGVAPSSPVNGDVWSTSTQLLMRLNGATQIVVFATDMDNTKIATITFIIDGGGVAITTGVKGFLEIPFACTIIGHTMLLDQSGSIVIDIWKDTYANFPPTVADTITASDKPTISAATKAQDLAPTGWITAVAAGDILGYNVDSITTATRCTISLKVVKS